VQPNLPPTHTDIVLVGGGHAHVAVLRMFGMKPEPGVRLTVVAKDTFTPYSGMIPGYIAGHYDHAACHIDLGPLCRFANARLIHAAAEGIDLAAQRLLLPVRPPLRYDLVSFDIGSTTAVADIPGAAEHGLPVKPLDRFLEKLGEKQAVLPDGAPVTVAGGGAGGAELALALAHRLRENRPRITLVTDAPDILMSHAPATRAKMRRVMQAKGIEVMTGQPLAGVGPESLRFADGSERPSVLTVLATGSAPAQWLAETGLALDERGFIAVGEGLASTSHPNVFAAGDIASFTPRPLPKAGVYAVRAGPVLTENLRRAASHQQLKPFKPQSRFLSLLSCGDQTAIASYGSLALSGPVMWRWKDWIDTRWMRRYQELPDMAAEGGENEPVMRCAGCGAKIAGDVLTFALDKLDTGSAPGVILGAGDDAAVLQPPPGQLLVQSTDGFRAFIGDPYLFGRITTIHALSDLYAMGAKPHSALAHATLPFAEPASVGDDLYQLLAGACFELKAAGAALVGGHSSEGAEMAFSLTVNGFAEPGRLWRKAGAAAGDTLILTKPLGTGALLAADMRGKARSAWIEAAFASMLTSNAAAVGVLRSYGAKAATDVTGFGLLGHLREMMNASGTGAEIDLSALPVLAGAAESLADGIESTLAPSNRAFAPDAPAILSDPQTSGGLLAALPAVRAEQCVAALHAVGYDAAAIVGHCVSGYGITWR
jgi:selenide,water dikinase